MIKRFMDNQNLKVWFILFCALNLTFFFYLGTFFWGNHDWDWVKGTSQVLSLNTGMFEGRYAKFILNVILFGGQILPLLNAFVAFGLLAAGGLLLVKYWQIDEKYSQIIVALMPLLAPFVLGWLYFPINILGNFAAVALVAGGLILSQNDSKVSNIAAVICFLIALGVYPSVMEMMIICFCFRYILKPTTIVMMLKKIVPIAVALILFKLLLWGLGRLNFIVADYYNLKTVSMTELLSRTPQMLKLVFSQLITTLPFLNIKLKMLSAITIMVALGTSCRDVKKLTLWLAALGATILSTWLTGTPEETAYMPRVNFYGLNFFYAGALAVLLQNKGIKKNIGYILGLAIICQSMIMDISAQKVWYFGKNAEEQLVERISSRLEAKNSKRVVPVIAGTLSLRPRYYTDSYQKESSYLLNAPFMVRHIPSGMFNFYAISPLFYGQSQISEISTSLYDFLKTAKRSYPALESIYQDDLYAVILLTPEGISAIQAQMPY